MKKIWLIAFFLLTYRFAFCGSEFNSSESVYFEYGKIQFKEIYNPFIYNYALSLDSKNIFKHFQIECKYGNLSASGNLSKLNSPSIYNSVSAFSKASVETAGITSSFSSVKENSFFMQNRIDFSSKKIEPIKIQFFYKPENINAFGFDSKINLNNKRKSKLFFSGASVFYDTKEDDFENLPWFNNFNYFRTEKLFCQNFAIGYQDKNFKSIEIMNFYENPDRTFKITFRTENIFINKNNTFNFSFFCNLNDSILTSSQKNLKPLLQLKTGIQRKKLLENENPKLMQTGFNTLINYNILQNNLEIKNALGVSITDRFWNTNVLLNVNNFYTLLYNDFYNYSGSFKINTNVNIKKVKLTLSSVSDFSEDNNFEKINSSEKISVGIKKYGEVKMDCSYQVKFDFENWHYKKTESLLSCKLSYKQKYFSCSVSCSFNF